MSVEFKLPDLGEGIHEAEILAVKVSQGDTVAEDQPIFEVETDKAVVEIPSPVAGVVEKIHVKEGDIVTVGSVMVTFTEQAARAKAPAPVAEAKKAAAAPEKAPAAVPSSAPRTAQLPEGRPAVPHHRGPVPATPATRRMAREMGVDLRHVRGSGPA
ncbi:MAG TPA: biotin/lipoyl-containing protein, partial [Candidatus Obscuribacterales bacterium]